MSELVQAPQQNALTTFETAYGSVSLSPQTVRDYLTRGNKSLSDQEVMLFIQLCKYQGLNPFVNEAYAIKFGDNFQMVVGYDTYKRRAYENPDYKGRKSGIVVKRGDQIICKEGTCVYPGEDLLGGWCRVFYIRNGVEAEEYREVSMSEFNKNQGNWKVMPATMIEKVAVSQCLRSAFPKDFTGLYTPEEIQTADDSAKPAPTAQRIDPVTGEVDTSPIVTKEQRKNLFDRATMAYGGQSVEIIKKYCEEHGFRATTELTVSAYQEMLSTIEAVIQQQQAVEAQGEVQ